MKPLISATEEMLATLVAVIFLSAIVFGVVIGVLVLTGQL